MSISLRIGAPAFVPGGIGTGTGTGDPDAYRIRNDYEQEKQDPSTHRSRRRTRKTQAKSKVEKSNQCAGEGHQHQRHPSASLPKKEKSNRRGIGKATRGDHRHGHQYKVPPNNGTTGQHSSRPAARRTRVSEGIDDETEQDGADGMQQEQLFFVATTTDTTTSTSTASGAWAQTESLRDRLEQQHLDHDGDSDQSKNPWWQQQQDSAAENGLVFLSRRTTKEVSTAQALKTLTVQETSPVTPHARLDNTGSSTLEQHYQPQQQPQPLSSRSNPQPQISSRRSLDISKLRDRWWDACRNYQPPSPPPPLPVPVPVHRSYNNEPRQHRGDHLEHIVASDKNISSTISSGVGDESDSDLDPDWCYEKKHVSLYNETEPARSRSDPLVHHLEEEWSYDYSNSVQPLHEAVQRNDGRALKRLLLQMSSSSAAADPATTPSAKANIEMSPLQLAVHLDRPRMLRILLGVPHLFSAVDSSKYVSPLPSSSASGHPAPLLMAAELGREECLQMLLLSGSSVVLSKDTEGNNVLHYSCRGDAPASTLRLILQVAGNSLLPKLWTTKNLRGQTPLHCICQHGRVDLLEEVLSSGSLSLLTRVLSMQDVDQQTPLLAAVASGSSDIVMSLLMWRGNNYTPTGAVVQDSSPCPLVWAVQSGNVDMVLLLLEFNDPSGTGYNLTNALHHAFESTDNDESRLELMRVLIGAGANPCTTESPSAQSAIRVATARFDADALMVLLDSYNHYLASIQDSRRRDPILQKQPESFFRGMESCENAERLVATRDALVTSLFLGWRSSEHSSSYHACSLVLYRREVKLGQTGIGRLHLSLVTSDLKSMEEVPACTRESCMYQTQYFHAVGICNKPKDREKALSYWSNVMRNMPWITRETRCAWLRSEENRHDDDTINDLPEPDIVLVADDGSRFLAHGALISQRSAKLGAALRFASMSSESEGATSLTEVPMRASSKVCRWVLQHIYHGSILSGELSRDAQECCWELMELLLAAEEFICRSLVQECEMRLLAADPRECFCVSCARAGTTIDQQVDCHYLVDGPSHCITPDSALDVLAVAQHVSEACLEEDYMLCVTNNGTIVSSRVYNSDGSSGGDDNVSVLKPMQALREVAVCTVLQGFQAVSQSDTFASQLADDAAAANASTDTDGATPSSNTLKADEWLLQMCLQELATSPGASLPSFPAKRRHQWLKQQRGTSK
jgi:ankyrin repeat protein